MSNEVNLSDLIQAAQKFGVFLERFKAKYGPVLDAEIERLKPGFEAFQKGVTEWAKGLEGARAFAESLERAHDGPDAEEIAEHEAAAEAERAEQDHLAAMADEHELDENQRLAREEADFEAEFEEQRIERLQERTK